MKVPATLGFARASGHAMSPRFEHPRHCATVARTRRLVRRRRTNLVAIPRRGPVQGSGYADEPARGGCCWGSPGFS